MAKKLFHYYKLLLAAAELDIEDTGGIFALNSKAKTGKDPMMVDGKKLVMPYIERLREPNDGSTTFFHPFAEEFGKGESPAISALRSRFRKVIAMRLGLLQVAMAQLASSATPPKVLNSHQQEGLQAIKECSSKVFDEISRIITNSGSAANIRKLAPVELYLSRKSPVSSDVTYQRWLTIRFPLYEEIVEQQKKAKADRSTRLQT